MQRLGIELVEIPDWNCCGASSAHMTNHEVGVRLPMRNLLLAAELGNDILVPCAACFQRLKAADKIIRARPATLGSGTVMIRILKSSISAHFMAQQVNY